MKYIIKWAPIICLCLLVCSCGKKADAVLIVKEDGVTAKGQAEFVFEGGGYRANVWVPGNIVIFRVDKTVEAGTGKAGMVYLIDADRKLQNIGKANLSKTDDELAAEYLKSGK